MSREIKFRAWIQADPYDESDSPKMEMCYNLAFEDYEPVNDLLGAVEHLMQYTGLKDRHGTEIYEGDIVRWKMANYESETFFYDKSSVIFNNGSFDLDDLFVANLRVMPSDYEVIGNIYEGALSEYANPDIIEQYDIQNDRSPQKGNKRGEQRAQGEQGNSSKDRASQQKESRA